VGVGWGSAHWVVTGRREKKQGCVCAEAEGDGLRGLADMKVYCLVQERVECVRELAPRRLCALRGSARVPAGSRVVGCRSDCPTSLVGDKGLVKREVGIGGR